MSLGFLPGAHQPDCPVYARILAAGAALDPPGRPGAITRKGTQAGFAPVARRVAADCMPSPPNGRFASGAISAINSVQHCEARHRVRRRPDRARASRSAKGALSMHDIVIRGGTIIDGTGAPAFTGDVAIDGGRIAAVGGKAGPASARSTPTGCWSRRAGSMCTPITTARRRGTRCSRPPPGMASRRSSSAIAASASRRCSRSTAPG